MKKRHSFFIIVFLLISLVGCNRDEMHPAEIALVPTIMSRVGELQFDAGDSIGLTVSKGDGIYLQNQQMIYDGFVFTGEGLLWYNNFKEPSTLTACHPYSIEGMPEEFSVALDQSAGLNSSDLLGAVKRDVMPASAPVKMLFRHLMTQLTLVINNQSGTAVSHITVDGFVPTASVDWSIPAVTAKSGVAASSAIKAYEVSPNSSYRVILVPQRAPMTVTVTMSDGNTFVRSLTEAALEAGKRYDLSVRITPVDMELALSGEIMDWVDGGTLDGGHEGGGGNEPASELVYGDATYPTLKIGGKVWMAENLRYLPQGSEIGTGIWYPASGAADMEKKGLLYDYATATQGKTSQGSAPLQGICPEGWHLPSKDELNALIASNPENSFFQCAGFRIVLGSNNRYGDENKGYLMGCTQSDGMMDCIAYTMTQDPPALAQRSVSFGLSVRCVAD